MFFRNKPSILDNSISKRDSLLSRGLSFGSQLLQSTLGIRKRVQDVLNVEKSDNTNLVDEPTVIEEETILEQSNSAALIQDFSKRYNTLKEIDETSFYQEEIDEDFSVSLFHAKGHKKSRSLLEVVLPNEDKVSYFKTKDGKRVAILLDGISQSNRSSIFVSQFLDKLKEILINNSVSSEEELIAYINNVLCTFSQEHSSTSPGSTCAMALEKDENRWIYLAIGDAIIGKKSADGNYIKLNHEQVTSGNGVTSFLQPGVEISTEQDEEQKTRHLQKSNVGIVEVNDGDSLFLASDGVNYLVENPVEVVSGDSFYTSLIAYHEAKPKQDEQVFEAISSDSVSAIENVYQNDRMIDNVSSIVIKKQSKRDSILSSPDVEYDAGELSAFRLKQSNTGIYTQLKINQDGELIITHKNYFPGFITLSEEFNVLFKKFKKQFDNLPNNRFTRSMFVMKFNNDVLNLPILPQVKTETSFTDSHSQLLINQMIQDSNLDPNQFKNHDSVSDFVSSFSSFVLKTKPNSISVSDWLKDNSYISDSKQLSRLFQFASLFSDPSVYPIPDIIDDKYSISSFEDLLISDKIINMLLDEESSNALSDFVEEYSLQESLTIAFQNVDLSVFASLTVKNWKSLTVNCSKMINGWNSKITKDSINSILENLIYDLFEAGNDVPKEFIQFLTTHLDNFVTRPKNVEFLLTHKDLSLDELNLIVRKNNLTDKNKDLVANRLSSVSMIDPYSQFYNILNKIEFSTLSLSAQKKILSSNGLDFDFINGINDNFEFFEKEIKDLIIQTYFGFNLNIDFEEYSTCDDLGISLQYNLELKKLILIDSTGNDVSNKYFLRSSLSQLESNLKSFSGKLNQDYLDYLLLKAADVGQLKVDESQVATTFFKVSLFGGLKRVKNPEAEERPSLWSRVKSNLFKTNKSQDRPEKPSLLATFFNKKTVSVLTPLLILGGAALYYSLLKEPMPDPELIQSAVKLKTQSLLAGPNALSYINSFDIYGLLDVIPEKINEISNLFSQKVHAVTLDAPLDNNVSFVKQVLRQSISLDNLPIANSGVDVLVDSIVDNYDGGHVELTADFIDGLVNGVPSMSDIYDNTQEGIRSALMDYNDIESFSAEVVTDKGRLLARNNVGDLIFEGKRSLGHRSGTILEFDGTSKLFKVMIEGQEAIIKYFRAVDGNYYAGTHITHIPTGV